MGYAFSRLALALALTVHSTTANASPERDAEGAVTDTTVNAPAVPEPALNLLVGLGLTAAAIRIRRSLKLQARSLF